MSKIIESVDVAVAIVEMSGHLLIERNENWGAFGFPMTRINGWEKPQFAAARAASEVLGIPLVVTPGRGVYETGGVQQSGKDGRVVNKNYSLVSLTPLLRFQDKITTVSQKYLWLTADEIFGGDLLPIASSMSYFIEPLNERLKWISITVPSIVIGDIVTPEDF